MNPQVTQISAMSKICYKRRNTILRLKQTINIDSVSVLIYHDEHFHTRTTERHLKLSVIYGVLNDELAAVSIMRTQYLHFLDFTSIETMES